MDQFAVILPAAGRSTRFGDPKEKKIYADLDGRAVWLRAVEPFLNRDDVGQIIIAIAPEDRELFERRYQHNVAFLNITVLEGGAERSDSVAQALAAVKPEITHVAVHDAARPCLTPEQVDAVFAAARKDGAALLAVAVADTLKRGGADGKTIETVPRAGLFQAQTPQVFRRDLIQAAYDNRHNLAAAITDDAQLVEALGTPCTIVEGSSMNIKITRAIDLKLASAILQAQAASKPDPKRPIHPFASDEQMWK